MTILSNAAVTELKGVGAKMAERLAKVGIETIQDVLFHLPSRYEDRTRIYPISDLQPFLHVSVQGEVSANSVQFGRKRMLIVRINDGTGSISLRFFHFSAAQKKYVRQRSAGALFWRSENGKARIGNDAS